MMELFYLKESVILDECDHIVESVRSDIEIYLEDGDAGEQASQGLFQRIIQAIGRLLTKIKNLFTGGAKEEKLQSAVNDLGDKANESISVVDQDKVGAAYDEAVRAIENGEDPEKVQKSFKEKLVTFGIPAALIGGVAVVTGVAATKHHKKVKAEKALEEQKKIAAKMVETDQKLAKLKKRLDDSLSTVATFDKNSAKNIVKNATGHKVLRGDDKEKVKEVQAILDIANTMIKSENYSSDLILTNVTTLVHNGGTTDDLKSMKNDLESKHQKFQNSDAVEQLKQRKANHNDGRRVSNTISHNNREMEKYNNKQQAAKDKQKALKEKEKNIHKQTDQNNKELSKKVANYGKENVPKKQGFFSKLASKVKGESVEDILIERTVDTIKELMED